MELKSIVDYLEAQIRRRKVDVQLNYRQTAVGLLDLEADLVIVATGAIPPMPNFPEATVPVLRPWDVLRNVTTCGNGDAWWLTMAPVSGQRYVRPTPWLSAVAGSR